MKKSSRTASHWDSNPRNTEEIVFWSQHPTVQRRLAIKESGRPDGSWIDHTLETHFSGRLPLARCLSLGCGRGRVERQWAERRAFLTCDAYDISPASIANAAQEANQAGFSNIHYAIADIEQMELPVSHYDAVWAVASAHHFTRLEHVFDQAARKLKPDGLFVLYEYVGANRFQFDERQSEIIDACLRLLPMRYRLLPVAPTAGGSSVAVDSAASVLNQRRSLGWIARRMVDKIREGTFLSTAGRFWRKRQALRAGQRPIKETSVPTERSVMAVDPTEAVRSSEIVSILETLFDIIEYRPLGGSILQFLLADIAGNLQDEVGEQLLEIFFHLEDTLMACGDLPSDFAYIVARPRLEEADRHGAQPPISHR